MDVIQFPTGRRARPKGFDRSRYERAVAQQERDRLLSDRPYPACITLALDAAGLDGPEVDRALGVWDPPAGSGLWEPGTAVDRWEDGTLVPTHDQVVALAGLTGQTWRFFYVNPGDLPPVVYVCGRN